MKWYWSLQWRLRGPFLPISGPLFEMLSTFACFRGFLRIWTTHVKPHKETIRSKEPDANAPQALTTCGARRTATM